MGVELWLIRHGETAWSLSGAHTSRTDIPLTDEGRARATKLGGFLKQTAFARVLVSPMQRAGETCKIAGFGPQATIEDGLREWDYGEAEGKTTQQLREMYHDPSWGVWTRPLVGGELLEHVGERADGVIARAVEGLADGAKVALFAHAHILRILAARWIGLSAAGGQHFGLGTGSVSVLGWEREARIVEHWNRGFDA
jgi:broad specificity phosphatase PhoE